MEIKTTTENGRVPVTVIQVNGSIDSSTYEAFQSQVNELIEGGARYILLDLSETEFISSAGFRAFNDMFNRLRSLHPDANLDDKDVMKGVAAGTYKSPHLKLLGLSKDARTAFELAGFDMFIETFTDRKKAIASF
ncbi:MAG TPA: STAS domain-containing protein [Anaerolineales bacterium]|nr:STAS domain-containing protein [Anaerolineales bacterium]